MAGHDLWSWTGFVLTAVGAVLLYLTSGHQRLLRTTPPATLMLIAGAVTLVLGITAWVMAWGGMVGGLLALAVWMSVSAALPYALARRPW